MVANRPRGLKTTELALRARLIASGIRGWYMHSEELPGEPDFVFNKERLAIFVDGCFWHGCTKHRGIPETNSDFWRLKIRRNQQRDKKVTSELRKNGWSVLRFWEHDLSKNPSAVLSLIVSEVGKRQPQLRGDCS